MEILKIIVLTDVTIIVIGMHIYLYFTIMDLIQCYKDERRDRAQRDNKQQL